MRLPSKMTKEEINRVVEETITEMGLEDCADNRIGNWHSRGISNGEKKRLSIGLEILTQPYVLLLDEPTTGLDSASAFYVIQALTNIACNGRIVICSIHQPCNETFSLFDDLLLLSCGETVYFGEANMALKEEQEIEANISSSTTWLKQLCTLTKRSFVNMTRDIGYYWPSMIFCIMVFSGERSKGHYGEAAYVVSNIISSFPFLLVLSIFSGTIIYYMVKFHPGFANYAFLCINLFCCLSVVESCIMVVASVVQNVLMGLVTGTGVIGQFKNEMLGVEIDPLQPGDPKISGEVLTLIFGVPLNHDKWWDLTALIILLLVHRLLLSLVLRYNKTSISLLLWFYICQAKSTLRFTW
ncbi:hypothetical protein VNO77_17080 [Canavalia gladiata]|uniref:Uncharacterized protein n=1 Tax=Canavalia gladiata TaxID=3824 RepID=A0AAN9LIC0_CANGL